MGKRKVTILEPAVEEVARVALHIEGEGLPKTAKRFVDDAFAFFESLADDRSVHRPCKHPAWKKLDLRCVNFLEKFSPEFILCPVTYK